MGDKTPPRPQPGKEEIILESPDVYSVFRQGGARALLKYGQGGAYQHENKYPLMKCFPPHIVQGIEEDAAALRAHPSAVATALLVATSTCAGTTFARGVGGMITRPHHFETFFCTNWIWQNCRSGLVHISGAQCHGPSVKIIYVPEFYQ